MKKIVLTFLIFFSLTKLWAEESQYKINDLRLSVDSINSMIVDAENEGKDITASYLGLGGAYEYNKPSGKYLSALKADGSYNINNESQSVASARINAGLSKKQGK
jgi:hypothetical protein